MAESLEVTLTCSAISAEILVTTAVVREAISQPTRATVHFIAMEDIDGEATIGEKAHLQVSIDGAAVRHFQLVVTAFRLEGIHRGNKRRYAVELAHELTLLALRSDVRMFQEKDAKAIVEEVLQGGGLDAGHYSFSLQRTPSKRTYCVQYRESDLSFVSRLLEHEGIFYVIQDDASDTSVTFADAQSTFTPVEGDTAFRLTDDDMHGVGVHDFILETKAVPAQISLGDYNFNTPSVDLTSTRGAGEGTGDHFEFGDGFQTQDEGTTFAKIRHEEVQASATVGFGRSDRMTMRAGAWFELDEASRDPLGGKYLIRSVEHRLVLHAHEGRESPASYENQFSCIPHAVPFRPPRLAPRPRVRGAHSAVVTGPGGEIHTDSLGRMKGKFFWDRVGKDDDTSSCWMRVAQLPIGGSVALARMGWEMGVVYYGGDPDRPMSIVRLYNAEKVSPYGYPAAKTRMSLKTMSSPASGKFNELRMEDGGGGMEMFVNASKDYDSQTNNNRTESIGVDEKVEIGVDSELNVGADQSISIGASRTETVSADAGLVVGADRSKSVGASETATISGNLSTTVKGSDSETTGGSHTTLAALGIDKTSTGSFSLTVGGSMISAAGLGAAVAVAGAKSETVGGASISASATSVSETVAGALARTVGGVMVQAAAANRTGGTKGPAAITVGGLACANAGSKLALKGKKISIKVAGVANFLGGGGIINLTPASAAFVGLVTLDASGSITISGNPNLVG